MADEVYRKVGRGGAGNFYSKKDIAAAAQPETSDLEAQPISPASSTNGSQPATTTVAPEYLHTGRGGAGNWTQPSADGLVQSTSPAVAIPVKKPVVKQVYRGGRGGAGNFHDVEAEEKAQREEEERLARENEERIVKDVERGLARPEKTYQGKGGSWEMQ